MVDDEKPILIIDNGSGTIKAGMAGEDAPSHVLSSVIGKPKSGQYLDQLSYFGDEAIEKRDVLDLKYPISAGIVNDWETLGELLSHTFFDELK